MFTFSVSVIIIILKENRRRRDIVKKIVAINASPRANWNTAQLVKEAGLGAKGQNAEVKVIDLYKLDKFTGCISCFG